MLLAAGDAAVADAGADVSIVALESQELGCGQISAAETLCVEQTVRGGGGGEGKTALIGRSACIGRTA